MKINKIISIAASLFIGTTLTSCTDWLDLKPEGQIVFDDFWQDKSQVEGMLATCYKSFTTDGASNSMLLWGELRGDNVIEGESVGSDVKKMLEVDIDAENWICNWGSMYTIINYCNTFIKYAPDVPSLDPNFTVGECNTMIGEVRALRAMAYFYLVRTFKEVPYIDEPSITDDQDYNKAKSSEDFVLDKIEADLIAAERVVRTQFDKTASTKGRITKNAVRAALADVYLWRNQYANCIAKCDEVMADTTLKLVKNVNNNVYSQIFGRGNSTESIFELQYNNDIQWNNSTKIFYGTSGNLSDQRGEVYVPEYLITAGNSSPFSYQITARKKEADNDKRKSYNFVADDQSGINLVFKYAGSDWTEGTIRNIYSYRSNTSNWIMYRLPDVMLMKAEALVEQAKGYETSGSDEESGTNPNQDRINNLLAQALKLVNETYERANKSTSFGSSSSSTNVELLIEDYNSTSKMSDLVLRERHRELMFEGKRWFDLMRLARRGNDGEGDPTPLVNIVSAKFEKDEAMQKSKMSVMNALYLPIPQSEINVNKLLEQNPFYQGAGGNSSTIN